MISIAKSYKEDIEFQVILSLAMGFLFAPLAYRFEYSFAFIVAFEIYVFLVTEIYAPSVRALDRILINLFFIFGWVLSRIAFNNETGFEDYMRLS